MSEQNTEAPKKIVIRKTTVTKVVSQSNGSQENSPSKKVVTKVIKKENGSVVKTTSIVRTTVEPSKPKVPKPTLKSKENQERLKKSIELRKKGDNEKFESISDDRTNSLSSTNSNENSQRTTSLNSSNNNISETNNNYK